MSKMIVVVTLLGMLLHVGQPLRCEKCNGCETGRPLPETCRNVDPSTQIAACLTQVVRVSQGNEPMTVKKCTIFDKNVQYRCQDLPNTNPIACNVCYTDMCNDAPAVKVTSTWIGGIIMLIAFNYLRP